MTRGLAVTGILVTIVAASAGAQRGSQMSAEDQQEILAYRLTLPLCDTLIAAMGELNTYVLAAPAIPAWVMPKAGQTRADQVKAFEADPGAIAIAKRHGLTTRNFLTGSLALKGAILKATQPTSIMSASAIASEANIAFIKANVGTIKPKFDAMEEQAAAAMMKKGPIRPPKQG